MLKPILQNKNIANRPETDDLNIFHMKQHLKIPLYTLNSLQIYKLFELE